MLGRSKKAAKIVPQTESTPAIKNAQKGMVSIPDIIAPSSAEVDFNHIRVGEKYYKTLFVIGYPRYVSANWLQPVIEFDHTMNISMFIYPTQSAG